LDSLFRKKVGLCPECNIVADIEEDGRMKPHSIKVNGYWFNDNGPADLPYCCGVGQMAITTGTWGRPPEAKEYLQVCEVCQRPWKSGGRYCPSCGWDNQAPRSLQAGDYALSLGNLVCVEKVNRKSRPVRAEVNFILIEQIRSVPIDSLRHVAVRVLEDGAMASDGTTVIPAGTPVRILTWKAGGATIVTLDGKNTAFLSRKECKFVARHVSKGYQGKTARRKAQVKNNFQKTSLSKRNLAEEAIEEP